MINFAGRIFIYPFNQILESLSPLMKRKLPVLFMKGQTPYTDYNG